MSRIRPVSHTRELCVACAQRVPSGQPPSDVHERSQISGICTPASAGSGQQAAAAAQRQRQLERGAHLHLLQHPLCRHAKHTRTGRSERLCTGQTKAKRVRDRTDDGVPAAIRPVAVTVGLVLGAEVQRRGLPEVAPPLVVHGDRPHPNRSASRLWRKIYVRSVKFVRLGWPGRCRDAGQRCRRSRGALFAIAAPLNIADL